MPDLTVTANIDSFLSANDYAAAVALLSLTPEYGSIYVADGVTAQSIATGATPTKLTGFTTDGIDTGTIANAASNQLDLTAGDWLVTLSVSFSGDANVEFYGSVFVDEVQQAQLQFGRKLSTGGDVGSACCMGIVSATAGQALSVRMTSDDAGAVNVTPLDMNLSAEKIS